VIKENKGNLTVSKFFYLSETLFDLARSYQLIQSNYWLPQKKHQVGMPIKRSAQPSLATAAYGPSKPAGAGLAMVAPAFPKTPKPKAIAFF
jgi:hypothetical protein